MQKMSICRFKPVPFAAGGSVRRAMVQVRASATPAVDPEIAAYQAHEKAAARISPAEEVRTLVANSKTAMLSTISASPASKGYPNASVLPYAEDEAGRIICSLSTLASHTKDLMQDGRASVIVTDPSFATMNDARCTITGTLTQVADAEEASACRDLYMKRHPDHFWVDFGDFSFYRMDQIVSVSLNGGFGRAAQVRPDQYWETKPDPVAPFSKPVCSHMNADHKDATIAMVKAVAGITVEDADMLSVDRLGINTRCSRDGSSFKVRLPFPEPAEDRKSIKDRIVAMTRAAAAPPAEESA